MPRPLRIEYPGALYHILSRGDRREAILLDEFDRHTFLRTLDEACQNLGAADLVQRLTERLGRTAHKHELGRERDETDTQRAERLVSEWLCSTGWTEAGLSGRAKGEPGKVELARLLRQHTPMSRQWIAERLRKGSASNVTKLTAPPKSVEYET